MYIGNVQQPIDSTQSLDSWNNGKILKIKRLDIEVELYDMIGNKVISESNVKRLDLSKLSNGIYNMSILYNNVRYSKKVIKQ